MKSTIIASSYTSVTTTESLAVLAGSALSRHTTARTESKRERRLRKYITESSRSRTRCDTLCLVQVKHASVARHYLHTPDF